MCGSKYYSEVHPPLLVPHLPALIPTQALHLNGHYLFFSFRLVLSRLSLTNHHFHSFQHCSLQYLHLWSSLLHPCTLVFSSVPALLNSLAPAPNATRSSLVSCLAVPLFYLLSFRLLTFRTEYLNASWIHTTFCLPLSHSAGTLISKCVLRKEGPSPSWEQPLLTTGTAGQPLPLDYALSPSFPCSYASSCCWQCNNIVRWGKTDETLALVFQPRWHDWRRYPRKQVATAAPMSVHIWWVDLGWLPDSYPDALSLPSLNRTGRKKNKMKKIMGQGTYREIILLSTGERDSTWGKQI